MLLVYFKASLKTISKKYLHEYDFHDQHINFDKQTNLKTI